MKFVNSVICNAAWTVELRVGWHVTDLGPYSSLALQRDLSTGHSTLGELAGATSLAS